MQCFCFVVIQSLKTKNEGVNNKVEVCFCNQKTPNNQLVKSKKIGKPK